jgi:hypothetical protein
MKIYSLFSLFTTLLAHSLSDEEGKEVALYPRIKPVHHYLRPIPIPKPKPMILPKLEEDELEGYYQNHLFDEIVEVIEV